MGSSERWAGGSTGKWRTIRAGVLKRDGHLCQLRIPGVCVTVATQVHHKVARELVGDNPDYLCGACQPCNNRVGSPNKTPPSPRIEDW